MCGKEFGGRHIKEQIVCSRDCHFKRMFNIAASIAEKRCTLCKRILPTARFGLRSKTHPLPRGRCRDCERVLHRALYNIRSKHAGRNRKASPEKRKARGLLQSAVRRGKIKRMPCEKCGKQKTDAHHEDYSKPYEVQWLCRKHHMGRHRMPVDTPITEETARLILAPTSKKE